MRTLSSVILDSWSRIRSSWEGSEISMWTPSAMRVFWRFMSRQAIFAFLIWVFIPTRQFSPKTEGGGGGPWDATVQFMA